MECNVCAKPDMSNFRARAEGEPFKWYCHECYDFIFCDGSGATHEIDHPILCYQCAKALADLRCQSKAMPDWVYWCYGCYETFEHTDLPHDISDVDSASSDQEDKSDGELESALEPDAQLHQDDALSLNSWCHPEDSLSLKSWTPIEDDCKSNDSFMLSWNQIDEDA